MASVLEFLKVVVSPIYQLLDFPLKSPLAAIKKGLVVERASRVSLNLSQKFAKSSSVWFSKPVQRNKVENFIFKFYHKAYTFIKVINIG